MVHKPTQKAVGLHLDMSQQQASDLESRGIIDRSHGIDSVRVSYIRHLREIAAGRGSEDGEYDLTAERARLAKWQADEKELDVAVKRGELIPSDEVIQTWARLVVSAKASLLALSDRLQQMMTLSNDQRDAVDKEVRAVLEKLSAYEDTSTESD